MRAADDSRASVQGGYRHAAMGRALGARQWLISLLLLPALHSDAVDVRSDACAVDGTGVGPKVRIAYVTNTWWPKVDGAAITVMGHVHYFSTTGHPVLVVRPQYPVDSPVRRRATEAGMDSDPVPPSDRLTFLSYRMLGDRGGGFEPEMDASDLARVEAGLAAWAPDVVLVVDPDYFVLDTFRVPGLNSVRRLPQQPTMIACMTTFCIEAIRKMPEYWWLNYAPAHLLFLQGLATAYGQFDHIFVNGEQSAAYLKPLRVRSRAEWIWHGGRGGWLSPATGVPARPICRAARTSRGSSPIVWVGLPTLLFVALFLPAAVPTAPPPPGTHSVLLPPGIHPAIPTPSISALPQVLHGGRWEPLPPARVVRSRGVPADFCTSVPARECDAVPGVRLMRQRPPGALAFVYVGRLSYDKSVDELLRAFERARASGRAAHAVLYLAGSGELEALIAAHVARIARGERRGDEAGAARGPRGDERGRSAGTPGGLSIVHLGQVPHGRVSCVLREADAYVSAAHNETYGRSLVEALRCGLPVVGMRSCNMHVAHQTNGLLAGGEADLADHIRMVAHDAALRTRLSAGARAYDGGTDGGLAPDEAMLRAVLEAHSATCGRGRAARAWHPFWTIWMGLSIVLDQPR